ncbi:MAG: hypothetical protein MI923_08305 [Phycisphaerales bacterium]|nr:hypothetical protein [Phycisphaerales bacterium]
MPMSGRGPCQIRRRASRNATIESCRLDPAQTVGQSVIQRAAERGMPEVVKNIVIDIGNQAPILGGLLI